MEFLIINKKEILLNIDELKREKRIRDILKTIIKSVEKIQSILKDKD